MKKTPQAQIDMLAEGMARGQSLAAAARAAGIVDRTARNIVTTPSFKQQLTDLRQQVMAQVAGGLAEVAVKAVAGLASLLDAPDLDPETKLKVCRGALADWLSASGQVDLAERTRTIEERLDR